MSVLSGLAETLTSDVVIPLSQTGGFGLKPEYELLYVGVCFLCYCGLFFFGIGD